MTADQNSAPILLVRSGGHAALPEWQESFAAVLPGVEIRWWDDAQVDPARVRYALVWEPDPGRLRQYPALELIFSSAAGVDHILRDPDLPQGVPIIRMGAEETTQTVAEFICLATLAILRDLPRITAAQREARWDGFERGRTARQTRVGIMGMGRIGRAAADMLGAIGFAVHGWTRTRRDGEEGFAGMEELDAFLGRSDILVAVLPDTPETRYLMDAKRLAALPRGAGLVNVGRGTLCRVGDVIAALDSGQLSTAVLDVFEQEPLPADNPAWHHPRIIVTSHVAGYASRPGRAESVARCIRLHEAGEPIDLLYDPARGY
jgi:glyoxylate/hydroxypyruvate reductase A